MISNLDKSVVIIPTYDERDNIVQIVPKIFNIFPQIKVTVVDDNSPDGTGDLIEELMNTHPNLSLISRQGKEGLGKAYMYAFEKVLKDATADKIIMMDADLSHDPSSLSEMLVASDNKDVVIGSRYVNGGGVEGWELWRRILSMSGNLYAKTITRMPIHDCTSGFNIIKADFLRKIDFNRIDLSGYAFLIELKYMLWRAGASIEEIPITFKDRGGGKSKISNHIISEGIIAPWKMIFRK